MTPKQKAAELVQQFLPHVYCYMGSEMLTNDYDDTVTLINAKQCAIILVDEIIKTKPYEPHNFNWHGHIDIYLREAKKYWENIKLEIELIKSIDEIKQKV